MTFDELIDNITQWADDRGILVPNNAPQQTMKIMEELGETAGAMVYSHFGDIKIKSGKLSTEGGNITAGNFIVDMTTIDPKDEGYSEENPAAKLVGHLATADFFNVEEYPESSFEITSVEGNTAHKDRLANQAWRHRPRGREYLGGFFILRTGSRGSRGHARRRPTG